MEMSDRTKRVLTLDSGAGCAFGLMLFGFHPLFVSLWGFPETLVWFLAATHLTYGLGSGLLLMYAKRRQSIPRRGLMTLIVGNIAWGLFCVGLLAYLWPDATIIGRGQLIVEALFVAGLGVVEYRWVHPESA